MSGASDFRALLQQYSEISTDRLRLAYNSEEIRLSEMQRGIVILLARWSGPSIMGFRKLTRVLNALPVVSLDVAVIDFDLVSEVNLLRLFGNAAFPIGGNAETAWVRAGIVVAREIACPAPEELLTQHTLDLLNDTFS